MVISRVGCRLRALIVEVCNMTLLYISVALAAFIVAFLLVVTVVAVAYLVIGLCWLTAEAAHALTNSNKEI